VVVVAAAAVAAFLLAVAMSCVAFIINGRWWWLVVVIPYSVCRLGCSSGSKLLCWWCAFSSYQQASEQVYEEDAVVVYEEKHQRLRRCYAGDNGGVLRCHAVYSTGRWYTRYGKNTQRTCWYNIIYQNYRY
jgi:hypothetical protein